jgi:hypothetical protein
VLAGPVIGYVAFHSVRHALVATGLLYAPVVALALKASRSTPRILLFPKHVVLLVRELVADSIAHRAWWPVPVLVVLWLLAMLVTAGQAISPYLYTVF